MIGCWVRCKILWLCCLALSLLLGASPAAAKREKWRFQNNYSNAHFQVKHLLIGNVRGTFHRVDGEAVLDPDNISHSSVRARIYIGSLCTGNKQRDQWLQGKRFFDAARFPVMLFQSRKVEEDDGGHILVTGDLTLHGIRKEITLDLDGPTPAVNDRHGIATRAVTARAKLDRKDFGIVWNETLEGGGVVIGDEVLIEIDIELVRAPTANKAVL